MLFPPSLKDFFFRSLLLLDWLWSSLTLLSSLLKLFPVQLYLSLFTSSSYYVAVPWHTFRPPRLARMSPPKALFTLLKKPFPPSSQIVCFSLSLQTPTPESKLSGLPLAFIEN